MEVLGDAWTNFIHGRCCPLAVKKYLHSIMAREQLLDNCRVVVIVVVGTIEKNLFEMAVRRQGVNNLRIYDVVRLPVPALNWDCGSCKFEASLSAAVSNTPLSTPSLHTVVAQNI